MLKAEHAANGHSAQYTYGWYCAGHLFGQLEGTLTPVPL